MKPLVVLVEDFASEFEKKVIKHDVLGLIFGKFNVILLEVLLLSSLVYLDGELPKKDKSSSAMAEKTTVLNNSEVIQRLKELQDSNAAMAKNLAELQAIIDGGRKP